MRNMLGTLYAALGAGLIAWPFSPTLALVLTGAVLFLSATLLLIDWDGR